jgi:hypothetical protein
MATRHTTATIVVCLLLNACGGNSTTGPSPTPTTPAVASSLTGTVTATGTTVRVSGFTVTILDGQTQGRTATTNSTGAYTFDSVVGGNANVSATATGWEEVRSGVTIAGPTTLNFTTRTTQPWTQSSRGNNVFTKPLWVTRMSVTGLFTGSSSNFIVWCGSSLLVNELIGTFWNTLTYQGTHATPSCSDIRIENSTGVLWALTEVR